MTEAKALRELKKGSEAALEWFIDRYSGYVCTVIHNIIGASMDYADLEEVASDVFFIFWENAKNVHSPKGFLGTVARNTAKNKLREIGQELPFAENFLILEDVPPEAKLEQYERAEAVRKALAGMKQPDRDIFLRFYYYEQTIEEISEEMHINLSTVKTKLRRGRIRLKNTLLRYIT